MRLIPTMVPWDLGHLAAARGNVGTLGHSIKAIYLRRRGQEAWMRGLLYVVDAVLMFLYFVF